MLNQIFAAVHMVLTIGIGVLLLAYKKGNENLGHIGRISMASNIYVILSNLDMHLMKMRVLLQKHVVTKMLIVLWLKK